MMKHNLLILGASSDLAIALIPKISENFQMIFAHYNQSVDELRKLQKSVSCQMELLQADFTNESETKQFMDNVVESQANITHILHCPSARPRNERFQKLTWADYSAMLDTQIRSLYYAANRFLPQMAKQRYGKVVAVLSSYTAGSPPAYLNAYITAKYAQLGFVKSLAAEYAAKSVQINAVSPSMIETKFLQNVPSLVVAQNSDSHPLKRNAAVKDIIPVIEFLLSDQNNFITGQNLLVSGGSVI